MDKDVRRWTAQCCREETGSVLIVHLFVSLLPGLFAGQRMRFFFYYYLSAVVMTPHMHEWMNGCGCYKSQGPVVVKRVNHQQRASVQHLHPRRAEDHRPLAAPELGHNAFHRGGRTERKDQFLSPVQPGGKREALTLNEQSER